jgi:hypothetical protein
MLRCPRHTFCPLELHYGDTSSDDPETETTHHTDERDRFCLMALWQPEILITINRLVKLINSHYLSTKRGQSSRIFSGTF